MPQEIKIHCLFDEMVKPSKLKKHPKNRNKHPKEQIERLAKILTYQGFRYPIKVSKLSGFITSGHGRLEAAKLMKLTDVPVVYQEYESDEQEYADVQSDNAIASWSELDLSDINTDIQDLGPDFDIDLLGIKNFTIDVAEKEELTDPDEVPDVVHPISVLGDVWLLGNHRLMCGDSTSIDAVEKLMNGQKPEMVYTDPPYGIDVVSSNGTIGGAKGFGTIGGVKATKPGVYMSIKGDDTIQTAVDSFNLCKTLEIPVMIFWGANYYASGLGDRKAWIVWDKETTGNFSDCELAWTSKEGAVRRFKHVWNGMIKQSEKGQKRVHPTQKPIALAEWCFENFDKPNSVMDLFGGSGSTLIACEKTNKKCFMMEFEPHYVDVIINRWQNFTGEKAKLESSGQTYEEIKEIRDGSKES